MPYFRAAVLKNFRFVLYITLQLFLRTANVCPLYYLAIVLESYKFVLCITLQLFLRTKCLLFISPCNCSCEQNACSLFSCNCSCWCYNIVLQVTWSGSGLSLQITQVYVFAFMFVQLTRICLNTWSSVQISMHHRSCLQIGSLSKHAFDFCIQGDSLFG